jgi:hypothetical protein
VRKFTVLTFAAALAAGITACTPTPEPIPPTLLLSVSPNPVTIGQRLSFSLGIQNTNATWNVALFVEDPDGQIDQFLPNRLAGGTPTVAAGSSVVFPSAESTFYLAAAAPTGSHTALLYISLQPLNLEGISAYADAQAAFATVGESGVGNLEGSVLVKLNSLNNSARASVLHFKINP